MSEKQNAEAVNLNPDTRVEDIAAQMQDQPVQTITAFVVPPTLFGQMVELIRGNVCHRDAQPVMDQCAQLQPQEMHVRP